MSRGSLPRVRRYGLLHLWTVEYDHWCRGNRTIALAPMTQPWKICIKPTRTKPHRTNPTNNSWDVLCIYKNRERYISWWRHQMEIVSALLAICEGNPLVTGGFPSQRRMTRSLVFFDLRLNQRLSKQPKRRWFETPSRSLYRHCKAISEARREQLGFHTFHTWISFVCKLLTECLYTIKRMDYALSFVCFVLSVISATYSSFRVVSCELFQSYGTFFIKMI